MENHMTIVPTALSTDSEIDHLPDRFHVDDAAIHAGDSALSADLSRFARVRGTKLLSHDEPPLLKWQQERTEHGLWPYFRSFRTPLTTRAVAVTEDGRVTEGINFGCQDYLSL